MVPGRQEPEYLRKRQHDRYGPRRKTERRAFEHLLLPGRGRGTCETLERTYDEVLVEKSAEADSTTTRLADKYHLRAEAVTVGVFDMNGHYVGVTTQGLPQGRYMVRQKVNGRIVNKLVRKD